MGIPRVCCDVRHASEAGSMLVLRKSAWQSHEARWHRGYVYSSLTDKGLSGILHFSEKKLSFGGYSYVV